MFIYVYFIDSVIGTVVEPVPGKKKTAKKKQTVNKDFNVEYAKSGRAVCCGCQDKIVKVRLKYVIVYDHNCINK